MLTHHVVTATCNHIINNIIIRVCLALHYTNFTSHIGVYKCGNVTNPVEVAQVFQQLTTEVSIVHNLKRQSARNDAS